MAEPKPLAAFVSKLCRNAGIVSVLKEYLEEESGEPADEAVSKLTSGEANQGEQESAADYLSDFVHNEATEETLFYASSGEDWFPITIQEYAGVFWVWVPEFERVGYFDSREDGV